MAFNDRFAPSSNGAPHHFVPDADQLIQEFQQIELLWKRAEDMLASTRVPVDVEVEVSSEQTESGGITTNLSYEKVKGSRRICYVKKEYDSSDGGITIDCRPVVECPVDLRVEMFPHFEKLYAQAVAVVKSYIPKLRSARLKFESYLDLLDL